MKNLKHTPGPWKISIDSDRFTIYAQEENHLIRIERMIRPEGIIDDTWNRIIADAKLKTAAPEMLEMLIEIYIAFKDTMDRTGYTPVWLNQRQIDLIEKATGLKIEDIL